MYVCYNDVNHGAIKMKKQLLTTLLSISLTTATFAYEKVEGGIKAGKTVYPTEMTTEQLAEIDKQFHGLIDFLLSSEAINDQEKTVWLAVLPKISQEKRQKLYDILLTERRQMEVLVQKYEEEVEKLNKAARKPKQTTESQSTETPQDKSD